MIRKFIPKKMKKALRPYYTKIKVAVIRNHQKRKISEIRKKGTVKVAFLLVNEAIWKYESLYFRMKRDPKYCPVVFICPFITYGEEIMKREMNTIFAKFKDKGYDVTKTINEKGEYLDICKYFSPDIVFFSTPWSHSLKQYQIKNFSKQLTCYVHYGISSIKMDYLSMDTLLYSWKYFAETNLQLKDSEAHPLNDGKNIVITGFTGIDNLIDKNYKTADPWKQQNRKKKRIIWAPHHTIPNAKGRKDIFNSNFLELSTIMFEMAKKYEDSIQIAFKPHPNLRGKLNSDEIWGKQRTDDYYSMWENLHNGQLCEGSYVDLFLTSDGLIHDSSSFLLEYIYINKPVLFFENTINKELLNEIGVKVLNAIQLGENKSDIEMFITDIVLNNNDSYKEKRQKLLNDYLLPPNNLLASQNIISYLNKELINK